MILKRNNWQKRALNTRKKGTKYQKGGTSTPTHHPTRGKSLASYMNGLEYSRRGQSLHCIREKYTAIEVQFIDADVFVLLLAYVGMELDSTNDAFNVFFKMVTPSPRRYDIFHVINRIGIDICKTLSFFYCYTGCDINSSFNGKRKCSFFDAWMKVERKDELRKTFFRLGHMPESIESRDIFNVESLAEDVYFQKQSSRGVL